MIDELERMQVFYVNIGGGEPTVRPDFWNLVDYATAHHVGVKFSTNGVKISPEIARRLAAGDYVDVQISLDGATAEVNDAVRGPGSYATALRAMRNLAAAGFRGFKISVVVTRQNAGQLDDFKAIADRFGAQLRLTRLRPSGRGADVWGELHPTASQQRQLYDWLVARGEQVLTGDSFFHLAAYGDPLPGLNLCGAGRVVCLIDPVGVRHPRELPGRERPRPRRLRRGMAGLGAVRRPAPTADRGRLPGVFGLRLVPRRVHGGQVLHRAAAGRSGPGVRQGAWPARARGDRRGPRAQAVR
jgi:mycofactocin radical SAM maturase